MAVSIFFEKDRNLWEILKRDKPLSIYYGAAIGGAIGGGIDQHVDPIAKRIIGFSAIAFTAYFFSQLIDGEETISINELTSSIVFDTVAVVIIILLSSKEDINEFLANKKIRNGEMTIEEKMRLGLHSKENWGTMAEIFFYLLLSGELRGN